LYGAGGGAVFLVGKKFENHSSEIL